MKSADVLIKIDCESDQKNLTEDTYILEGEETLFKIMELRNSKVLCDVMITNGNSVVPAHSCVLAAKSSFFLNYLLNFSEYEWSMKTPLKLNISYITKHKDADNEMNCMVCVSRIVEFLYCGKIVINRTHIKHFLNISCNLGLQSLVNLCQKFLCDKEIVYVNEKKSSHPVKHEPVKEEKVLKNSSKFSSEALDKINASNDTLLEKTVTMHERVEEFNRVNNNTRDEFDCKKCKLKFNSSKMFDTHRNTFHAKDFMCLFCGYKTFKLSYILFHLINMEHDENICSICLYETPDRVSLVEHLNDHKCDSPFRCYNCGTLFKVRREWQQHMLCYNKGTYNCESSLESEGNLNPFVMTCNDLCANYICEICGFRALYKSTFERHMSKHKEKTEQFKCPITSCSFSSRYKYNLKGHMLKHNTSKYFSCDLCALKFTQERNLKRHIQTVHSKQDSVYMCSRCDYKNARLDKAKAHCEMWHPNDSLALKFILDQHEVKKTTFPHNSKNNIQKPSRKALDTVTESDVRQNNSNSVLPEDNIETSFKNSDLANEVSPKNVKKSYILSETTGEFHIISENEGEQVPVASVTSTNVLTIGNFRKGTGSVTLNETTGVLTFNNINSESTGAVFLNESTGELSYINLGKESLNMDIGSDCDKTSGFQAHLNELTGDINDDDFNFDSFEMDIGNEDSCDGFDDVDGLLFDPIDVGDTERLDLFVSNSGEDSPKVIPHLNETTGELSFDYIESRNSVYKAWQSNQSSYRNETNLESNTDESYRLLLNEVTGEFS